MGTDFGRLEKTIHLGKFDHDLITSSRWMIVRKVNYPQMAELFRLVKYCNLPRSTIPSGDVEIAIENGRC